jgi:hypothetical protein
MNGFLNFSLPDVHGLVIALDFILDLSVEIDVFLVAEWG